MNRMSKTIALLVGLTLGWGVTSAHAEDVVRTELVKTLQSAQELIKGKKFHDALDKLHEADAVSGKSAYENFVVEQLRLIASSSSGEGAVAAKAYEGLIGTGRLSPADQSRYILAVANTYYQSKDYTNAANWDKRYLAEGGQDPQVEALLVQTYYLGGDYASVIKTLKTADHLTETQLQILGSSYLKQNDNGGYISVLEKLVASYPKDEYWADLIHRVQTRPGFADRLSLDVGRLQLAVGQIKTAEEYVDQAELALQAGLPAEAKTLLDQGFSKGVLGVGGESERHHRLQDAANKGAVKDLASLPKDEAEAVAAKDGNGLVAAGLNYLVNGQAAKAAQLIQQGIDKGGLKRLDDARLHLGLAFIRAGDKAKAAEVFHAVQGTDGTADLARLWLAQINKA